MLREVGCWPELTQDSSLDWGQVRAQAGGQLSCISSQGGTCPLPSSSLSTFSPTPCMIPPPPWHHSRAGMLNPRGWRKEQARRGTGPGA